MEVKMVEGVMEYEWKKETYREGEREGERKKGRKRERKENEKETYHEWSIAYLTYDARCVSNAYGLFMFRMRIAVNELQTSETRQKSRMKWFELHFAGYFTHTKTTLTPKSLNWKCFFFLV